ncbi:putative HLH DNA binding protein [Talaromyces proteolyticus]|uniref:HLH DNA binding protein n=1 Tax=Talaromyces proteolyticus TaxID=1131652 RepID=A0AAD4Q468_9EURO|nr:putative HLH DNA binding protein [Talaromyces proteolyticus]KAH8702382.1 putative HLH DNA binding protein [Talaromyces proteolyticus]
MSDTGITNADNNGSNKRKRDEDSLGPDPQRLATPHSGSNGTVPGLNGPNDAQAYTHSALGHYDGTTSDLNIDEQLLTHVAQSNGLTDDSALTANAKAALAANAQNKYSSPPDGGFDGQITHGLPFGDQLGQSAGLPGHTSSHTSTAAAVYAAREAQSMNAKPTVGSPEWHALRKNNHKEVERRRRETINEGINQIAQLVPNCDKNKGAILQRAIEYIAQLQEEKKQMGDRFDQTNLTTQSALSEITTQNSKWKAEVNRRGDIALKWIQRARDAGLEFDDYDDEKDLGNLHMDHNQNV